MGRETVFTDNGYARPSVIGREQQVPNFQDTGCHGLGTEPIFSHTSQRYLRLRLGSCELFHSLRHQQSGIGSV